MLVTPVYSPRSGSSVDPADKIPLNLINSPVSPLTHDGSGDKVLATEKEVGSEAMKDVEVKPKSKVKKMRDDKKAEGMKDKGDRGKGTDTVGRQKTCLGCNLHKVQTKMPNLRAFCQKDANGIANSEGPDQTAPLGAV